MPDDAELLRQYAEGQSQDAFTELVGRYLKLVYFAALRQTGGDAHLAQDVAQTVFVRLARNAGSLSKRPALSGWLYSATRYVALEAMRTERRRRAREQLHAVMNETPGDDGPPLDAETLGPVVDELVWGLRDRDRELVLLRFFHNRSYSEIGTQLGVSPDAARFRLDRSLEKMRHALERKGVSSATSALALALTAQAEAHVPAGVASSVVAAAQSQLSAGTGIGLGSVLFNAMATTKLTISVLGIVGILAIGSAIYVTVLTRDALSQRSQIRSDIAAETGEIRGLEQSRAALAATLARNLAQNRRPPAQPQTPDQRIRAALAGNPKLRDLWMKKFQLNLHFHFTPLYRALGFTPAQIAQFEQIWNSREIALIATPDAPLSAKLDPSDLANDPVLQTDLASMVSADQLSTYERGQTMRNWVDYLTADLQARNTALSAAQVVQLTQIFADNAAPTTGHGQYSSGVNWVHLAVQAGGLLSADQLTALQRLENRAKANDDYEREYLSAMKAVQGGAP